MVTCYEPTIKNHIVQKSHLLLSHRLHPSLARVITKSTAPIKVPFAGLRRPASRLVPSHALLFTKPAEQCFSLTTNQPKQCFSTKFQTSERGQKLNRSIASTIVLRGLISTLIFGGCKGQLIGICKVAKSMAWVKR